jgi:hypothetical protein
MDQQRVDSLPALDRVDEYRETTEVGSTANR